MEMSSKATSQESDLHFLKDQVQRLSASLSRHLSHCPKKKKSGRQVGEDADGDVDLQNASWLTNKRLLTPLLVEYDSVIDELTEQLASYKVELESMAIKAEQITEENNNLHSELRKALETQLQGMPMGRLPPPSSPHVVAMKNVEDLKERLQAASNEREAFRSLLKKTSVSLEAAQKTEQEKDLQLKDCKAELEQAQHAAISLSQPLSEMQTTLSNVSEEHAQCLRAMKAQESELSGLQEQLTQSRAELRAADLKMKDLTFSLDEKSNQIRKMESVKLRSRQTEKHSDERFHVLEMSNVDLEGKYQAAKRESATLTVENEELSQALTTLQSQISSMEQRESEIASHVKDSIQVAEAAIIEKDQVEIREKQLTAEVGRLRTTLDLLVQEAGERTRKEVSRIRDEYNESIDKMGLEIRRLEQECGECQAQLESCQREKKLIEKELDKSHAQVPLELKKNEENMHELQKRVILAERLKDDTLMKVEHLEARIKELDLSLAEEKEINSQTMLEHRRLQKKLEEDSLELRDQRIKTVNRAEEVQQRLKESELCREAAEAKLAKEVKFMEQSQAIREKELKCRLASAEEAHIGSMQELRDLLNAQYRLGAKWKIESKALSENYERVTSDLKLEIMRYKMRSDELTKQLKVARSGKEELSKKYSDMVKSNTTLQQHLKDSEDQVAELLANEKNLLNTRRDLQRQLDELKLAVGRFSSKPPEPVLPISFYQTSLSRREEPMESKGFSLHQKAGPLESTAIQRTHNPCEWNRELKELKRSIQKVRKDLRQKGESFLYEKKELKSDEDNSSEYSSASRDLTRQSSSAMSAI